MEEIRRTGVTPPAKSRYSYVCGECKEPITSQEELNEHRASHARDRIDRVPARLLELGILEEHVSATLEDFAGVPEAKGLVERWTRPGVLIMGMVGAGKTRLLVALCRHFLLQRQNVAYAMARTLFRRIRATYQEGARESEDQVIQDLVGVDFLAIDDLAHEGKVTEHVIGALHEILSMRHGNGKPSAITTNLTLEGIGNQYDAAIASRLGAWRRVVLVGKDWRKL
mgnify:CR=1 FL=1